MDVCKSRLIIFLRTTTFFRFIFRRFSSRGAYSYGSPINYAVRTFLFITLFFFTSCGYLVNPKIKTGIVNLAPGSYNLDPQHATVLFKITHMGMSTFVGRFNSVSASLEFDPKKMAEAKLSAIINIASVDVNSRDLEETLRGDSWFAAEKYPQAFFKTTSVKVIDDTHAAFTGDLNFHGVTAPIVLNVVFNGAGDNMLTGHYTLGFSATTSIKRAQFGMDYLIPAIGDEVSIEVFAEFQKQ